VVSEGRCCRRGSDWNRACGSRGSSTVNRNPSASPSCARRLRAARDSSTRRAGGGGGGGRGATAAGSGGSMAEARGEKTHFTVVVAGQVESAEVRRGAPRRPGRLLTLNVGDSPLRSHIPPESRGLPANRCARV
jgi:hypothetical protein